MEDERDAGYSDTQQMEMNVSAAGSADPRALEEEVVPEVPDDSRAERAKGLEALAEELVCSRAERAKRLEASKQEGRYRAQEVMLSNLSDFTKHESFIELCGLLGTKDIERSEFDALCSKGMRVAFGALGDQDDTLGEQAGAALRLSLDRIQGLAILQKRPMAIYERGGHWGGKEIPPHPSYALLKRAKLTPEFDPPK